MRRFDKKKNIQKLNEQLNKKTNSLTENSWADDLESVPDTLDGDPLGPTSDDLESPVELQHKQEVEDGIQKGLKSEGEEITEDDSEQRFTPAMGEPKGEDENDYDQDERTFTPNSRFGEGVNEGKERQINLLNEQATKAFKNLCGVDFDKNEEKKKVVTESDLGKFGGKNIPGQLGGYEEMRNHNPANHNYGDYIWDTDYGTIYTDGKQWCRDVNGELVPLMKAIEMYKTQNGGGDREL